MRTPSLLSPWQAFGRPREERPGRGGKRKRLLPGSPRPAEWPRLRVREQESPPRRAGSRAGPRMPCPTPCSPRSAIARGWGARSGRKWQAERRAHLRRCCDRRRRWPPSLVVLRPTSEEQRLGHPVGDHSHGAEHNPDLEQQHRHRAGNASAPAPRPLGSAPRAAFRRRAPRRAGAAVSPHLRPPPPARRRRRRRHARPGHGRAARAPGSGRPRRAARRLPAARRREGPRLGSGSGSECRAVLAQGRGQEAGTRPGSGRRNLPRKWVDFPLHSGSPPPPGCWQRGSAEPVDREERQTTAPQVIKIRPQRRPWRTQAGGPRSSPSGRRPARPGHRSEAPPAHPPGQVALGQLLVLGGGSRPPQPYAPAPEAQQKPRQPDTRLQTPSSGRGVQLR